MPNIGVFAPGKSQALSVNEIVTEVADLMYKSRAKLLFNDVIRTSDLGCTGGGVVTVRADAVYRLLFHHFDDLGTGNEAEKGACVDLHYAAALTKALPGLCALQMHISVDVRKDEIDLAAMRKLFNLLYNIFGPLSHRHFKQKTLAALYAELLKLGESADSGIIRDLSTKLDLGCTLKKVFLKLLVRLGAARNKVLDGLVVCKEMGGCDNLLDALLGEHFEHLYAFLYTLATVVNSG